MAFATNLPLDIDGCFWDDDGLEQPLSLRLQLGTAPKAHDNGRLRGELRLPLEGQQVEVAGRFRFERGPRGLRVRLELRGTDFEGRAWLLRAESLERERAGVLLSWSTFEGTLSLARARSPIRLRFDVRRVLGLGGRARLR